ncbi:hypothetical protein D3C74_265360 [compost metagenome]
MTNIYFEAWQMEWDNITEVLMNQYEYVEDQEVFKAYKREVLLLIDRYYIENNYPYKCQGSGAELLKLRETDNN